jgi:hypothetical protein
MDDREFVDKVNRGIIELKIPRERPDEPEYQKQGSEGMGAILIACAALGCAVAALILAIKAAI